MTENNKQDVDKVDAPDVLELQVKDLLVMMAEEGGTFADFSFRDTKTGDLLAFFAIGISDTAKQMRTLFYDSVDDFEKTASFDSEVDASNE